MTQLYKSSESSHWYRPNGEPAYDADLRQARKENLLPSVTTILRAAARPALENWKMTQCVLSALTLPRLPGEAEEDFALRVVADSNREASDAAAWGTKMHSICEQAMAGTVLWAVPVEFEKHVISLLEWKGKYIKRVISTEKIVTSSSFGYAGKLDLHAELTDGRFVVADFKGRAVKPGPKTGKPKVAWYKEQCRQLAAYKHADGLGNDTELMSVVIDRASGEIFTKIWTGPEAEAGLKAFLALNEYWRHDNQYFP